MIINRLVFYNGKDFLIFAKTKIFIRIFIKQCGNRDKKPNNHVKISCISDENKE